MHGHPAGVMRPGWMPMHQHGTVLTMAESVCSLDAAAHDMP